MVAPIRNLENKFFSSSLNIYSQQTSFLSTVLSSINTGMNILTEIISDNYDKMRGRTSSSKIQVSRKSSMSSTKFSIAYHKKMELNNTINENVKIDDDSPILSYEISQEKAIQVSIAANPNNNTLNKYIMIKCPTSNFSCVPVKHPNLVFLYGDDTVINIQLPYNPNALIKPDLWDSNFHPISLHSSIEYLVSDSKNIKNSLNFMTK